VFFQLVDFRELFKDNGLNGCVNYYGKGDNFNKKSTMNLHTKQQSFMAQAVH